MLINSKFRTSPLNALSARRGVYKFLPRIRGYKKRRLTSVEVKPARTPSFLHILIVCQFLSVQNPAFYFHIYIMSHLQYYSYPASAPKSVINYGIPKPFESATESRFQAKVSLEKMRQNMPTCSDHVPWRTNIYWYWVGGWNRETSTIPQDMGTYVNTLSHNTSTAIQKNNAQPRTMCRCRNGPGVWKRRLCAQTRGRKGVVAGLQDPGYLVHVNEHVVGALVSNLKMWLPHHRPILTCVGVKELGLEGMRVEIEAEAHVAAGGSE